VQLCGTTPCVLRGAEDLKKVCHKRIGDQFHVTVDGKFSWVEVECLGACVNAPMVQINYDFYEDLTADSLEDIFDQLAAGTEPKPGPQIDRQFSAPVGGPKTLTTFGGKGGTHRQAGAALADAEAKRHAEPASERASPEPKPPLGEGAKAAGVKKEGAD
jgi:NADH-quinone oxidoreductase subunit E